MFDLIATTLNLHSSEISWLLNNQVSAVEISNFLSNSKSTVNPITNLPYYPLANPKAIVAARSFIQIAISGNALTKLETDEFDILVPNLPSPQNQILYNPMWGVYFAIECINIKAEHPEWSNARI